MNEIIRMANPEKVAEEAARRWLDAAEEAVRERGLFRIALSGGETPAGLYRLMASGDWQRRAPWEQTVVFWGDERRVPPSHPDSNYHMAQETLLAHVPIPPQQIFRMPAQGLAGNDAREYEATLRRQFGLGPREWPRFDLYLLGMGTDGHIASIFPGTRAASDLSNMVIAYEVPQLGKERITLTLPVINHARRVLILVTGPDKAQALAATLAGERRPSRLPGQAVDPKDGVATWLVDEAAASLLP